MSPPSILPLLSLLLLFAVASAGPLDLPEVGAPTTPASTSTSASAAAASEERAVPAATLAPPLDGQYCTVGGAVFHNGERLPASADPDPCRACYCQGGEAVCTRVHCYRRPDCAPRHVPGSCCPKYDNCPPAPDERVPDPRVKDAATQTDSSAESTFTPVANTTATLPVTTTDATVTTDSTETMSTASTVSTITTDMTTTTMVTTSTETAASTTDDDEEEETPPEDSATSAYPPGIDLHALHEHLPFLSPGDANGPNT